MIGVLGGMGPMATADFLTKLVLATPAKCDFEHLALSLQSVPQVPDRTTAILHNGPSPLPALISMTKNLELVGVDYAVIACNTAHHWYDDLVAASNLDFLHIADAVCSELKNRNDQTDTVGLMATPGTIKSGFYQERLKKAGIRCIIPNQDSLKRIYQGIDAVKSNEMTKASDILSREAEELMLQDVKFIILGCTELSVVLNDTDKFIDSNMALAKACVARSVPDNFQLAKKVA